MKKVLLGLALLVTATSLHAVGPISESGTGPRPYNGANRNDFTDLSVQALGGQVSITRRWTGAQWEWNTDWADISFVPRDPAVNPRTPIVPAGADAAEITRCRAAWFTAYDKTPATIVRNDLSYVSWQHYRALPSPVASDCPGWDIPGEVYYNGYTRTITSSGNNLIFKDRQGRQMVYGGPTSTQAGKLLSYSRHGVTTYLQRETDGRLRAIEDHLHNPIIRYDWETVDDKPRLRGLTECLVTDSSLATCSGRQVVYQYDASSKQLVSIQHPPAISGGDNQLSQLEYNSAGQLVAYYDPAGHKTTVNIDSKGKLLSSFNADGVGATTSHRYDKDNRQYLLTTRDGHGTVTETWTSEMGQVVRRDINGQKQFSIGLTLSDNSLDTQVINDQMQPPRAGVVSRATDDVPVYVQRETLTDASGNITVKTLNPYGDVTRIVYPDGAIWRASYADHDQAIETVDENGVKTQFSYERGGVLTRKTEAVGTAEERTTLYDYYPLSSDCSAGAAPGALQRTTLDYGGGSNLVTEYEYDCRGNVTREIAKAAAADATDIVTQYSNHTGLGQAQSKLDGNGNSWHYQYDSNGNLLTEYEASSQFGWEYSYDAAGNLAASKRFYTDGANRVYGTSYSFTNDAAGQLTSITDGNGAVTRLEYDKTGRPVAMIDASQQGKFLSFNRDGRLAAISDSANNTQEISYLSGLPRTMTSKANGGTVLSTEVQSYDTRQRLTAVETSASGVSTAQTRRRQLDALGNLVEAVDAANNRTRYSYDTLNRIKTITDAEGGVTHYTYDLQGNITQVIDPVGVSTYYRYDKRGLLLSETVGALTNPARHYSYDNNGNRIQYLNAKGECTRYGYNAANQLLSVQVYANSSSSISDCESDSPAQRSISYQYDAFGRYSGHEDGETAVVYSYEPTTDRIASVSTTFLQMTDAVNDSPNLIDTRVKTASYSYYPNGQLQTYTTPEGRVYRYSYDSGGRLINVGLGVDGDISLGDYLLDQPQSMLFNGGHVAIELDGLLRRKTAKLYTADQLQLDLGYSYNPENHITAIADAMPGNASAAYEYDSNYRLTQAARSGGPAPVVEGFTYDAVGNRTAYQQGSDAAPQAAQTLAYNPANNQLTDMVAAGQAPIDYSHDANGHTTGKTQAGGDSWQYHYNAQERLSQVQKNSVTVAEYRYNAQGQRVQKLAASSTFYLYGQNGLAAEYNAQGELQREYGYAPEAIYTSNPLFMRASNGQLYIYQNDHLGTPQRLIDSSGSVVWQAQYDAFGKAAIQIALVENNLRFPGQYYDSESGLHQNWYRDYDSSTGRYIERDPIGLDGGISTYAYVENNSIMFFDSFGLKTKIICWGWGCKGDADLPPTDKMPPRPEKDPRSERDGLTCAEIHDNYWSCAACCKTVRGYMISQGTTCYEQCGRKAGFVRGGYGKPQICGVV